MSDVTTATDNGETQNTATEATTASTVEATTTEAAPAAATTEAQPDTKDKSLRAVIARSFEKLNPPQQTTPTATATPATTTPGAVVDPISNRVLDPIKVPAGVPLTLRDKWNEVPREYQEFWSKREKDINTRLTQTADDRKFADSFKTVLSPYSGVFKQHNVNAVEHVKGLLEVNHKLHAGNPMQRAQVIADLAHTFIGTDAQGRQALAALLTGKAQHVTSAPGVPQKTIDEQVEERLKSAKEEQYLAEGAAALDAVLKDPKNEFASEEDIRDAMGAAIDSGLVDGKDWAETWANAYKFACANHEGVKAVLAKRQAATQQTTTTDQRGVQSVKPSLGSGTRSNTPPKFKNLREAAAAAVDKHWK